MNHAECKISVIMPVYNLEKYLRVTLKQVLCQTLQDIEIICTDDGSTDKSLGILKEFAAIDSRVRVFSQTNQGAGSARNNCLDHAQGKYVVFLDGDDLYPEDNTLEKMYDVVEREQVNIAGGHRLVLKNGVSAPERSDPMYLFLNDMPNGGLLKYTQLQFDFNYQAYIYNRSFLCKNNIRFPNYRRFQDPPFFLKAMISAGNFYYLPFPTYVYRWGHQNIAWNEEKVSDMLSGLIDDLELSNSKEYAKLHALTADRIEKRYQSIILSQVNRDNIRLFGLIVKTSQEMNLQLLKRNGFSFPKRSLLYRAKLRFVEFINDEYNTGRTLNQIKQNLMEDFKKKVVGPQEIYTPVIDDCIKMWEQIYRPFAKKNEKLVKVSVIIPVYNAEEYLEQCLESVLRQTDSSFEVICIEDGSTDNSRNILFEYAASDSRVKLVLQDNCGAAAARNRGISLSVGEYLFFLDADDFIADTLIQQAYSVGHDVCADIVLFSGKIFDDATKTYMNPDYFFRQQFIPEGKSVFSALDCNQKLFQISNPAPWTKFFRREYVIEKKILFENLENSNDITFVYSCMALAERITYLDRAFVYYRTGIGTNIQNRIDKHPTCIVSAFMQLRSNLISSGVMNLLERSWSEEFINCLVHVLKSAKTRETHRELFLRLKQDDVVECGLFTHENDFYKSIPQMSLVQKYFSGPARFADSTTRDSHIIHNGTVSDPVVSVIVPIYNVENYLEECLRSLCRQSLKEFEVICVVDGATDNSREIALTCAAEDPRITVVEQKNSGLSAARNTGIQCSTGRFVVFLDSDDLLKQEALKELSDYMIENNLEHLFFGSDVFFEHEQLAEKFSNYDNYYTYRHNIGPKSGVDLFAQLEKNGEYRCSACLQMVSRSLLEENHIRFYDGIIHEDELYTIQVLLCVNNTGVICNNYHQRRIRDNSIITNRNSLIYAYGIFVCFSECNSAIAKSGYPADILEPFIRRVAAFLFDRIEPEYRKLSIDEKHWMRAYLTLEQRILWDNLCVFFDRTRISGAGKLSNTDYASNNTSKRLNDHDTALRYAQEELAVDRNRLNDHDTALRYAQMELAELRQELHNSLSRRIARIVLWLPRKIKRFLRRILFVSARE